MKIIVTKTKDYAFHKRRNMVQITLKCLEDKKKCSHSKNKIKDLINKDEKLESKSSAQGILALFKFAF